jgi:alpha-N-arabinofuranosidase
LGELEPYIQDALDLIEFANGDVTTKWGKLRADMGHPASFNMKFLGIGNEQWDYMYVERLAFFVKALREQHPEIVIIGSSGPAPDGDKFDYLWPEMSKLGLDLVDEHYYRSPECF